MAGEALTARVVDEVGGHGGGQIIGAVNDGSERRAVEQPLGAVDEIRASDVYREGGTASWYVIGLNHRDRSRGESDGQSLRDAVGRKVGDEQGYGIVAGQGTRRDVSGEGAGPSVGGGEVGLGTRGKEGQVHVGREAKAIGRHGDSAAASGQDARPGGRKNRPDDYGEARGEGNPIGLCYG